MPEISPSKYLVQVTWDDVPHLDEKTKQELLASYPPHTRLARSQGIPGQGAGAIYTTPIESVVCPPFPIPDYWKRAYGLDVGWNMTAAVWLTQDPTDLVYYAYAEYARGEVPPIMHAEAIKARGAWIPGAVDPASAGANQKDGENLFDIYTSEDNGLGLNLIKADNRVNTEIHGEESGIYKVWSLLESGRMRIFASCMQLQKEYRNYHRVELPSGQSKIVKKNDHAVDAWRYATVMFDKIAIQKPPEKSRSASGGWSAADRRAGY